jgi:hypothetical protein
MSPLSPIARRARRGRSSACRPARRVALWTASLSLLLLCLLCLSHPARAETLEAPVGGAPISLGEGRVACARGASGWLVEPGGQKVRPPVAPAAVGTVVELRVAPTAAECGAASAEVRLATTGAWPAIDPGSFVLAADEGRARGRGRGLAGVIVSASAAQGLEVDTCRDAKPDAGTETCSWGVPKDISTDPNATTLRWWPAGSQPSRDAVVFNAEGKRAAPETFSVVPARVELVDLFPANASVDVSSGVGHLPLTHPEAITDVDCGALRCTIDSGALLLPAPAASVAGVDVKLRLLPRVFYVRKGLPDPQPTLHVSILRCPMTAASGPPLRGVEGARVVMRLEGACMKDIASLGFVAGAQHADVAQTLTTSDAAFVVLELGFLRAQEIAIEAVRGEGDGKVVAMIRVETRPAPVVHSTLEITGFPPIDFIPNNRSAIVHGPHLAGGAELALVSVPDVYEAAVEGGVTTVRGDVNAAGLVALQFGYRAPTLPHPLDEVNLAVLSDALQRGVKEANIAAPFGLTAASKEPLAEVLCTDEQGAPHRLLPGIVLHLPFSARYGCRVILHRERLSPEYGTQKLTLEIEVDKLDGTSRGEAHVTQTLALRSGSEPRIAFIRGVAAPYDRIVVRLSHVADEGHYLGALDILTGEPAVQWTSVFATGRVRLYATSAIPTGLYRLGTSATSGVLSLSLGVLSRFTWLDAEGHEGLLGLEAGIMAFGLTGDTSSGGTSLTQVGAVVGLGMAIPIANAGSAAQASINLHAWFEQRLVGSNAAAEKASQQAVIFGPSISLGNVGSTF